MLWLNFWHEMFYNSQFKKLIATLGIVKIQNTSPLILYFHDYRSSHPEVFCEKDVVRNFAKFTVKLLWWSLCFNEDADPFSYINVDLNISLYVQVHITLSVPRGHPCPKNQMIHIFQLRAVKKIIFLGPCKLGDWDQIIC